MVFPTCLAPSNTIISFFKTHEEFTHLLFLDADIGIKGDSIIKLIQHEKDVIGAPVPLKGFDSNGNKVYNITNPIKEENLYTVDKVGTAVFMLSRKAVEDLCNNSDTYNGNTMSRGLQNNNINYDVRNAFHNWIIINVLLHQLSHRQR